MGLLPEVTYRLCQCPEQGKPENVNVVPVPQLPFAQDCPTHSKTKILEAVYRVLTSLLTTDPPMCQSNLAPKFRVRGPAILRWSQNGMAVQWHGSPDGWGRTETNSSAKLTGEVRDSPLGAEGLPLGAGLCEPLAFSPTTPPPGASLRWQRSGLLRRSNQVQARILTINPLEGSKEEFLSRWIMLDDLETTSTLTVRQPPLAEEVLKRMCTRLVRLMCCLF